MQRFIHYSIDDVWGIFSDLSDGKAASIFDQWLLRYLKSLNEQYGAVFSLYCFYERENFCLCDMTDKYIDEFRAHASWLRFGFHARNCDANYASVSPDTAAKDYHNAISELTRIAGAKSVCHTVRLHNFSGTRSTLCAMRGEGLSGLLCAETDRQSYALTPVQNKRVSHGGWFDEETELWYYPTDVRLEHVSSLSSFKFCHTILPSRTNIEAFTHEWALDTNVQSVLESLMEWAMKRRYINAYHENWRSRA